MQNQTDKACALGWVAKGALVEQKLNITPVISIRGSSLALRLYVEEEEDDFIGETTQQ